MFCSDKSEWTKGLIITTNINKKFIKHQDSSQHKLSVERLNNRIKADLGSNIMTNINKNHSKYVSTNRQNLKYIVECLLWLAKQGLALRGHNEKIDSKNKGLFKIIFSKDKPKVF
jgi:hypothetical protein